ncbi:MAG: PGPGW domain-containing protein [Actinomycetales bacterium]|nr:PGPGW domain-containing protein [Actinomycetales bacterium]
MSRPTRVERWLASWRRLPHPVRWVLAATVGLSLVGVGVVFLVLPGPGIPLIIAGLAVLATEFAWAEVALRHMRTHGARATTVVRDQARRIMRRPSPARGQDEGPTGLPT